MMGVFPVASPGVMSLPHYQTMAPPVPPARHAGDPLFVRLRVRESGPAPLFQPLCGVSDGSRRYIYFGAHYGPCTPAHSLGLASVA